MSSGAGQRDYLRAIAGVIRDDQRTTYRAKSGRDVSDRAAQLTARQDRGIAAGRGGGEALGTDDRDDERRRLILLRVGDGQMQRPAVGAGDRVFDVAKSQCLG